MMLCHRPASEEDLAAICSFVQCEDELFYFFPKADYPLTLQQLQQAVAQRIDATVVEYAGKVVAFANFYLWEQGGRCAIGNVIVSPHARRAGVGRYLINSMAALAFAKYQAAEVTVSCFNHNTAALLLYPRLGFVPYAIEARQDKQGRNVALVHMRLLRPVPHGS
jgi:ribosomal protein S18 acetylase RimI-like enzyme